MTRNCLYSNHSCLLESTIEFIVFPQAFKPLNGGIVTFFTIDGNQFFVFFVNAKISINPFFRLFFSRS